MSSAKHNKARARITGIKRCALGSIAAFSLAFSVASPVGAVIGDVDQLRADAPEAVAGPVTALSEGSDWLQSEDMGWIKAAALGDKAMAFGGPDTLEMGAREITGLPWLEDGGVQNALPDYDATYKVAALDLTVMPETMVSDSGAMSAQSQVVQGLPWLDEYRVAAIHPDQAVPDPELAKLRGGFSIGGFVVTFGADIFSDINGGDVLHATFNLGDVGPTIIDDPGGLTFDGANITFMKDGVTITHLLPNGVLIVEDATNGAEIFNTVDINIGVTNFSALFNPAMEAAVSAVSIAVSEAIAASLQN